MNLRLQIEFNPSKGLKIILTSLENTQKAQELRPSSHDSMPGSCGLRAETPRHCVAALEPQYPARDVAALGLQH